MDELELILTDILSCSRSDLYLNYKNIILKDGEFKLFDKIIQKRSTAFPLQYILGYAEFMGLRFKVNKHVLIPRPETEILVETVIKETKNLSAKGGSATGGKLNTKKLHILDIGTGSGCIAIALAKFLNNADIIAIDISKKALEIAQDNAKFHNADGKIKFLQSDILNNIFFENNNKFDIIVSNPPYVRKQEIGVFDAKVMHEPDMALDGGLEGLDFYRRINEEAPRFLRDNGVLFLELGYNQADDIRKIFSDKWLIEEFRKDYQGIERVSIIRKQYYCNPTLPRGEYSNRG